MTTPWGNPDTDSFRKKHVRETRAAGGLGFVHAGIVAVTARLLEGLSDLHIEIPGDVVSYDDSGTEAQRLGLAVHLRMPLPPPAEVGELATKWGFDGFLVDGQEGVVELRFIESPERAQELTDEALALKLDTLESEPVSGPSPIRWPGLRDLEDGDSGADVTFLRQLLGAGKDEPVGPDLHEAVSKFQARRGAPVNGVIDVELWRRILPERRPQVAQGDSGFIVRVLQAALVAYEGSEHRVSGTWGVLTTRDVRDLQEDYGLRLGAFVRAPEWAVLLGPAVERVEEARRGERVIAEPYQPPVAPDAMTAIFGARAAQVDAWVAEFAAAEAAAATIVESMGDGEKVKAEEAQAAAAPPTPPVRKTPPRKPRASSARSTAKTP